MTPAPLSPPGAPKKKQGMSGCLIALLAAGALVALACIVSAVMLGVAAQSKEGKKVLSVMGKGIAIAGKAMNAPGAQEVREAGCPEAMVMDPRDLEDIVSEFVDAGSAVDEQGVVVYCQGSFGLPTCDEVATAYRSAKDRPPGAFTVIVKKKGRRDDQCTQRYDD